MHVPIEYSIDVSDRGSQFKEMVEKKEKYMLKMERNKKLGL
jgi:hypothetical protein